MAQGTPQQGQAQVSAKRDALDTLLSFKIPKQEAADLISRAQGGDAGEIVTNALRLRGGKSQRPSGGGGQEPRGAVPVAPFAKPALASPIQPQQVNPFAAPPQSQPQIPGYGPPGGTQAAPSVQVLQPWTDPRPPPLQVALFNRMARMFQPAPPMKPSWYTGSAQTPPPAPIASGSLAAPSQTAPAMPMPAPVKPRVRVKAVGSKILEAPTPTEMEEAKQKAAGIEETPPEKPKAQELPLVASQEEYDKLPIGARFKHPDGFIYRKESESSAQGAPQKLQQGGVVAPTLNRPGEAPEIPELAPLQPPQPEAQPQSQPEPAKSTDTVPAELTPGEYVMPKEAVDKVGPENLDALTARLLGQQWGAPGVPKPGITEAGRTLVEPTGQTVDVGGHPALQALAYGPKSEGATAADMRQIKGAWDQYLQTGDIAVSPNLQKLYPLRSRVNVVDSKGNVVLANARVADTSMKSEGHPTINTFEIWNGPSLGAGYHLVPVE